MRAGVYHGPNHLEVEDVPEPRPGPGEVMLRVGFVGICGTDLHEYYAGPIFIPSEAHPVTGRKMPLIIGHEYSGTVVEIGPDVHDVAVGDRVAVEPLYRCGECDQCASGNYNVCPNVIFHGLMTDGGLAEYSVVLANMVHRLPDNVSLELGALVEPMAVSHHAAALGELNPGDTAVIFGAGPIGIGLWFALRGFGVEDIFVVEPSPTRRAAIEAHGATTLDPTSVDVAQVVKDITNGVGADAAFEAAGVQAAVQTAVECVAVLKPVVCVAIYEKPLITPLFDLVMKGARIQGSITYTSADYQAVIAMMAEGKYDTTGWMTTIALDDVVVEGFEALHAGTKMKVLVDVAR